MKERTATCRGMIVWLYDQGLYRSQKSGLGVERDRAKGGRRDEVN